jgi:hypothetical protein
MSAKRIRPRFPADKLERTIAQYRKLADQAKTNAARAANAEGKDWFLSLAKSMADLADALQEQNPKSD